MNCLICEEVELARRRSLVKRYPKTWLESNGHDRPRRIYVSKVFDKIRGSPDYGKHVISRYRFVHRDGTEVHCTVPVAVHNPFNGRALLKR